MLNSLDAQSRSHLQRFAGQVAFLTLIAAPVLLVDSHVPRLYLLQLRAMFTLSALVILVVSVLSRQPWSKTSFCIWDDFLTFGLLKSGCSIALWLLE
jgi:hypothetical protein